MKTVFILFALLLSIFALKSQAGLPPTTLKGQSGQKITTFNFEVPNHQAVKTATGTLIETGNKNLLKNPSFEGGGTNPTDWTCTNVTSWNRLEQPSPDGKFYVNAICPANTTCECSQTVTGLLDMEAFASAYFRSASPDTSKRTFFVSSLAPNPYTQEVPIKSGVEFEKYTLQLGAKTGTSVKIGVRIENGADSGAVRMDDFRLEYGSVFTGIKNTTNFKSYGPIQITSKSGANPTKGTPQIDRHSCGQDGQFVECIYIFSTATGTNGDDDYVFHLPSEFPIDTSEHELYTGLSSLRLDRYGSITLEGDVSESGALNQGLKAIAIPFTKTSFRIQAANSGSSYNFLRPSYFAISGQVNIMMRLRYKGEGLRSTVDIGFNPANTFSTNTNPLNYASSTQYSLSTLPNAPIGTFITFTYASGGNTRVQTTTAPTQSTSDMMSNGIRLFTRAYNASSTALLPTAIAIQIGKGRKTVDRFMYANSGKSGSVSLDNVATATTEYGASINSYTEESGVLYVDLGLATLGATTTRVLMNRDTLLGASEGFLVVNANTTPEVSVMAIKESNIFYDRDEFTATEVDTGRKWEGKPIYKRCHKANANLTASTTLVTWEANLNPVGLLGFSSGEFLINSITDRASSSAGLYLIYVRSSGIVRADIFPHFVLQAGTNFCMEYTKL